jgi:hypothetical protein
MVEKPDAKTRLLNGARLFGNLFRRGQMTACGWFLGCQCPQLMGEWCRAKLLWIRLALEEGRSLEAGEFGLVESFTASEFEASGVTLAVDVPGVGIVKVGGAKGTMPLKSAPMMGGIEGLKSVTNVLRAFPGSVVV